MDDEARVNPLPPLLSGLEKVLALEHSSTGSMTMAKEEDEEMDYLPEEELDDAAPRHPSHHHGDVLPSTWDLSDSWGTTDDQENALFVPGVGSSSTSGHYKWRPEAAGPYHAALSSDRRTARYVGKANHPQDVGTAKADRPLPRDQACFYFEVEVLSTFEDRPTAAITVGLAAKGFPMYRQPGTWPHSYGYRGLDGRLFAALPPEGTAGGGTSNGSSNGSGSGTSGSTSTRGKDYGPAFGKGDVIGCGVDFASQEMFYTKNGKYLGVAFHNIFRRPGQQQQQQQQQQRQESQAGARQGLVRTYLRPYLPNPTMPRGAPTTTTAAAAAAVPIPPSTSPSSSSSGDAPAQASSILRSRSRLLPEAAATSGGGGGGGRERGGGGGDGGDSAGEGQGGGSTNTTMSRGMGAAAFSRAALRASWLADAGEEEEEQDEDEDMEEEEEEGQAGGRESDEQSRRRNVGARQEGGGGGGGAGGGRSRGRRSASFSAGSSSSATASAANRTGVDTLYNTGRAMRQQEQQQQQQQAGSAASSPPALAVAGNPPEVAWDLFPVLSLHGIGESARVNFGQEPFCFDLQAKRAADEAERERQLAGEGLGLGLEEEEVHALIKDYLLVAGYQDTLRCFEAVTSTSVTSATTTSLTTAAEQEEKADETGSASSAMDVVRASAAEEGGQQPGTSSSGGSNGEKDGGRPSALAQSLRGRTERLSSSLTARQELREMLLSGAAVAAIMERLAKEHPQVWHICPALRFELHSLAFVDLLRQGALREALVYAQQELVPFALVGTHTPVEAEGGLEGDADQDGSVDMAVGGGNSNDDGHPSDNNGSKKPLRRRRSHSTREADAGGAAKRRSVTAPEPLSSSSFVSPALYFAMRLRDVMGLLAYYPNFTRSPVASLLSQDHREDVADMLNLAILEEQGRRGEWEEEADKEDQGRPLLERALVGLASMHETLREIKSGGRGEGFHLPALSHAQQV